MVDADDYLLENIESYMTPVTHRINRVICAVLSATLHGRHGVWLEAASQPSRRRNDDEGRFPIYLANIASFAASYDYQRVARFQSYLTLFMRLHDSL